MYSPKQHKNGTSNNANNNRKIQKQIIKTCYKEVVRKLQSNYGIIWKKLDKKVTILEKREHIGGNCFSIKDKKTGVEYHKYGTHIFHTCNEKVFKDFSFNFIICILNTFWFRYRLECKFIEG